MRSSQSQHSNKKKNQSKQNKKTLCEESNDKLGRILQYIIYFFNREDKRSFIINSTIKQHQKQNTVFNLGSISFEGDDVDNIILCEPYDISSMKRYFKNPTLSIDDIKEKNFSQFIKENASILKEKPITVFTCCFHYGLYNVHFVSVVYISKNKELLVFDSGIDVYPVGETHMLPVIQKAFIDSGLSKHTAELGKQCFQHRYISPEEPRGIQYAGDEKFKDAFCQTWTLWYISNFIKQKKVIRKVCREHPSNREIFLIKDFILPLLKKHPDWTKEILNDHKKDSYYFMFPNIVKTPNELMGALKQYSEGCMKSTCPLKKQNNTTCLLNRIK